MTTPNPKNSKPVREWRQVRISPEEEAHIQRLADTYGMSFPSTLKQVIRFGVGLPSSIRKSVISPSKYWESGTP
jgi:hypothetical protein